MLSQLLKVLFVSSSFGEDGGALSASPHAAKSPISKAGKSPVNLALNASNSFLKTTLSPLKPLSGSFK
jgi:hypothetical protein